jgi:pimeloyl-ACP methyl ester carboxylesterase
MNSCKKTLIIFPVITLILVSCGNRPGTSLYQSVLKADTCNENINHTYYVYVPSHSSACALMPLVIIIDPHGSGGYAIKNFIEAAEAYKFVLGASNFIRNNDTEYIRDIGLLIDDMKNKYPAGNKVYLAGFSGGARMALSYAQGHQINGVLACGALATPKQLETVKTRIFALSGRADFNFPEVANFILNESEKPSNLKIQLAGELHQWPSSEDLTQALGWLFLSDVPSDTKCISFKTILRDFSAKGKKLVDSLSDDKQYIQMKMICGNMLELQNLPDKKYFKDKAESMINLRAVNDEISQLRKSLQFEYRVREAYYNALSSKDLEWWKREVDVLNSKIEAGNDVNMQFALKRIKAFLGIVCYTLTNNALQTNDLINAGKMLEIYRLVEPQNPDMFFFFALYSLKTGREDLIAGYLKNALENGYTDTPQIKKEFPAGVWRKIVSDD